MASAPAEATTDEAVRWWRSRSLSPGALPYLLGAALVVVACAVVTAVYGRPVLPLDDAYTTVHDAQVLVLHGGHDPNYVGVSPLNGETSLVHLALVALLVPMGGELASYLVSWLCILAYVLGVIRLARVNRANPATTVLVVGLAVSIGVMGYQLLNGMETGMALAAVVWLLALAADCRHLVAFGLLCGIAPFVRPELGLLAVLLLARPVWEMAWAKDRRGLTRLLLAVVVGAAPWLAWSVAATGHLIPITVSAKAAWFAERGLTPALKLQNFRLALYQFAAQLGPLLVAVPVLLAFQLGRVALVFAAGFYVAYYVAFSSELNFYFDRYQYIMVPMLLLGLIWLSARKHRWWQGASVGVAAVSLVFAAITFSGHWASWTGSRDFTSTQLRSVAAWASTHLPKGATVMVHDAGYISYGTSLRLVDMVGLKSPLAVAINKRDIRFEGDVTGRALALNTFAQRERPGYLIVLKGWDFDFGITSALQSYGWRLQLLRPGPSLGDGYEVYALQPPGAAGGL